MASRALVSTTPRTHVIKNRPLSLPSAILPAIHHHQSYRFIYRSYSIHRIRHTNPPAPHSQTTTATLTTAAVMPSTNDFAKTLKALHKPGQPLIVPNVWDAPSLYALSCLNADSADGQKPVAAIATASWALAHARGAADEDLTAEQNLAAVAELSPLAAAAGLPLSADLQDGYGARIAEVFAAAARSGVAGANLEDSIPSAGFGRGIAGSLYPKAEAVERIGAALKAAAEAGVPDFVINARCDVFKLDAETPGLDDATRMREALDRGRAYLAAGATTVFFWGGARGLSTAEVKTLVAELDGRVAVLLSRREGAHSTAELAKIGVARISIGPSLYLAAMNAVKTGAAKILAGGGLA
ncbi:C6 transcription factor [Cordyceps fumosorosea ARSEF 2679]|uniref:C6 transcription factor n=1 Tax=Cordyceps fumosorosea (strain ARSEF 2679) TaxID=1081104 RepID=A0A168CJT0_CORFA|nr:C6 transcription factor [Cordyceps fumosorosea ARSEF 2679]OAA71465.1 C6 transcription factor [Cordyceps fumosorosea ARSEF 2679]